VNHGRKPRKPRAVSLNTLGLVLCRAVRLTSAEVRDTMAPARACLVKLREGAATEDHHTVLHTSLLIAQGIEASGIVRGLRKELASAMQAMTAVRARALATGAWRPTALYWHELDAITAALNLHKFQLEQLSAGELQSIAQKLIARTQSAGGAVARTGMHNLGLMAA